MTEKELHKLRRHDLLQLLLAQGREAAQLQAQIDDMTAQLETAQETNSRFIGRLDDKDAQIEKLKGRLDQKDAEMAQRAAGIEETMERLKARLDEKDACMAEEATRMEETFGRLKEKLNDKDALIETLRSRLDSREAKIEVLEAEVARLRSEGWKELQESNLPAELLTRLKALM